jgi:DNA-binding transcriptional LysR family regulator
MSVELRHFRAFLAVAEEGSVTRGAALLHISQPALSRTLQQLEDRLGVRLVDRSTHHLRLTSAGEAFRGRAAAVMAAVDAALDLDHIDTALPLRLGHAWSALGEHTTTLLRRWKLEHPDIPLELLRIDDRIAGLTDGRVDAALLRGFVDVPGMHSELVTYEPRVGAVPVGSPLAERATLSLADLSDQTLAVNTVSGTTTPGLWPADIRPAVTLEVGNTDDWLAAIASGRAVGVTPIATADVYSHPGVEYRPLTDAPPVPVCLAYREPPGHPAVGRLAELIGEITREAWAHRTDS